MNESGVYNEVDLAPFQRRLKDLRQIVQSDAEGSKHNEALTKLLERQLNECGQFNMFLRYAHVIQPEFIADSIVNSLQESLSVLSPELAPIHLKLVHIRRQLAALAAKEGSHKAELKPLQEELRKIDSLSARSVPLACCHVHRQSVYLCLKPLLKIAPPTFTSRTTHFRRHHSSSYVSNNLGNAWTGNSSGQVAFFLALKPYARLFWKNASTLLRKSKHKKNRRTSLHRSSQYMIGFLIYEQNSRALCLHTDGL